MNTPPHGCIHHLLMDRAGRRSAAAILAHGRSPLTYRGLWRHVEDVGRVLHATGLGRNDRVAVVLPNGPELAAAFLAVAAAATCAPLNPAYGAHEFDAYLANLQAKALIVPADIDSPARDVALRRGLRLIELSPMPEAEAGLFTLTNAGRPCPAPPDLAGPHDVALALHTAGTTARPKIVRLTHLNLCAAANNIRVALGLVEDECCLNVMLLFHVHGLVGLDADAEAIGHASVRNPSTGVQADNPGRENSKPWHGSAII